MTSMAVRATVVVDGRYELAEDGRRVDGRYVYVDILTGRLRELRAETGPTPRQLAQLDVSLGCWRRRWTTGRTRDCRHGHQRLRRHPRRGLALPNGPRRHGRTRSRRPDHRQRAGRARSKRYVRSSWSNCSALATASRTSSDTPLMCPFSSRVYHSVLTPARTATSSRRSPGTRRRPLNGRPTHSGVIFARRRARKSRISARFSGLGWVVAVVSVGVGCCAGPSLAAGS